MKKYNHDWLIAEWERMGRPEVEYLSLNLYEWHTDTDPVFYDNVQYRIKCKPWINWDHVSDDIVGMATDANGCSHLFCENPVLIGSSTYTSYWDVFHTISLSVYSHKSFTPGTCDWKDSLVMRPVVVSNKTMEI